MLSIKKLSSCHENLNLNFFSKQEKVEQEKNEVENAATKKEKKKCDFFRLSLLLLLLILIIILAISLAALYFVVSEKKMTPLSSICLTPACINAASTLMHNMDISVDPCQNFYQFACGGYEKKYKMGLDDDGYLSQFSLINELLSVKLKEILEEDKDNKKRFEKNASNSIRRARIFYRECLNTKNQERVGRQPLLNVLKKLGGWPVLEGKNWNETNFNSQEISAMLIDEGIHGNILFHMFVTLDFKNSSYSKIYLDQTEFGLHRSYLLNKINNPFIRQYFENMKKVAMFLGANGTHYEQDLKNALNFERKLAKISLSSEEQRNFSNNYNLVRLSDLQTLSPNIVGNWTQYIKKMNDATNLSPEDTLILLAPNYIDQLSKILSVEPKRNVANYVMWKIVLSTLNYLNKEFGKLSTKFAATSKRNNDFPTEDFTSRRIASVGVPRWKSCVGSTVKFFAAAISHVYLLKHFDHESKTEMKNMVELIREEFKKIINEVDWMDTFTKNLAQKKLHSMREFIGYPNELLNSIKVEALYKDININNNETYFNMMLKLNKWTHKKNWKALTEKADSVEWKKYVEVIRANAFYNPLQNSIEFPAGILQGTFFGKGRPRYVNYAAIGWIIGHEMTHGFDRLGRQYNAQGDLTNWWSVETTDRFENESLCLVNQFGDFVSSQVNMSLNGEKTRAENIADSGGLKQSYRAYSRWASLNNKEPLLPGLNFTQMQLFWLSAANDWCSVYQPKSLVYRIKYASHSPGEFRVRGSFANMKEFSDDFGCQTGTPMNPIKKCRIW